MTARITPDWQPETLDQRIERVIASVPELCPNCGGAGYVETDEHDDGEMHVGHTPCPMCQWEDLDPLPPRHPRR